MKLAPDPAVLLATLTIGVVVGISFIAQPAKFSAADVTLAQQVRIGSVIFHASHKVQAVLLLALALVLVWGARRTLSPWAAGVTAASALALQVAWLMPLLDVRVASLSAGQNLAPQRWLHLGYIVLDLLKLAALLLFAWRAAGAARVP
jgi:hypothetical protein